MEALGRTASPTTRIPQPRVLRSRPRGIPEIPKRSDSCLSDGKESLGENPPVEMAADQEDVNFFGNASSDAHNLLRRPEQGRSESI